MAFPFAALNSACLSEFGESVSYQPATGSAYSVTVIWTEDQAAEENRAAKAVAWARWADFTAEPHKGEEITRDGKIYRISEDPKDGRDGGLGVNLILRYVRDEA